MALLPGTPGQRISDLCNGNHITQKELAKRIGISAPQLSRIVSGETKTVNSDILIAVANEFKVSTDYILGLSNISVRKSYDISEIGLSENAVRGIVTKSFSYLISLIRIYFQDTVKLGIAVRNQIIDFATAPLSDIMKNRPENRAEVKHDMQFLNAQKLGVHEAEIEKIKSVFLAILRDIKKDIDNGEQPGEVAVASMLQAIREEVNDCQHEALSMENITDTVTEQIGKLTHIDEECTELFRELVKKMMEQMGKKAD